MISMTHVVQVVIDSDQPASDLAGMLEYLIEGGKEKSSFRCTEGIECDYDRPATAMEIKAVVVLGSR
jgi:hypothetical protein